VRSATKYKLTWNINSTALKTRQKTQNREQHMAKSIFLIISKFFLFQKICFRTQKCLHAEKLLVYMV
jgi:hypothetical protein